MRLVAWNCRQRFDGKSDALLGLQPDLAVIPECAHEPVLAGQPGVSFVWSGDSTTKGLGVFGFNGWDVRPADGPQMPGLLPVVASGPDAPPLLLLAVWTKKKPGSSYTSQVADAVDVWGERIGERAVMAGDFNASVQGPSAKRHLKNIERLGDLGMRSAYHQYEDVVHGAETDMTLRWIGPGRKRYEYHCDLVFASADLGVDRVEVGDMETWVDSGRSDHCPVKVDFTPW